MGANPGLHMACSVAVPEELSRENSRIACVGTHIPLLGIIFSLLVFVSRREWRAVLSMGIADYQPGDDAATLYARAGQALYRAKRHRWGAVEQA